jgi:hypothetical protein
LEKASYFAEVVGAQTKGQGGLPFAPTVRSAGKEEEGTRSARTGVRHGRAIGKTDIGGRWGGDCERKDLGGGGCRSARGREVRDRVFDEARNDKVRVRGGGEGGEVPGSVRPNGPIENNKESGGEGAGGGRECESGKREGIKEREVNPAALAEDDAGLGNHRAGTVNVGDRVGVDPTKETREGEGWRAPGRDRHFGRLTAGISGESVEDKPESDIPDVGGETGGKFGMGPEGGNPRVPIREKFLELIRE